MRANATKIPNTALPPTHVRAVEGRFALRDVQSQAGGFAALFVQALRLDPILQSAWDVELDSVKSLVEASRAPSINAWLTARGYPCSVADVKTALQTPIAANQQPSWDARRFATDLITNPTLRLSWAAAVNAMASAATPTLDTLNTFLTAHSYATTAAQVMNAIADAAHSGAVSNFVGAYGNTTMRDLKAQTVADAPVLLVNMTGVALGSEQILGTWDGASFSWEMSDLQDTSGSLQFDKSATDGYVGPVFSGTITYPDPIISRFPVAGQVTFSGRLGAVPPGAKTPVDSGSDKPGDGFSQKELDWIAGVGGIVAMITVTVPVIALVLQALDFKRGVAERAKAAAEKAEVEARAQQAAGAVVEVAPADLPAPLDPVGVVALQEREEQLREAPNPQEHQKLDEDIAAANSKAEEDVREEDSSSVEDIDESLSDVDLELDAIDATPANDSRLFREASMTAKAQPAARMRVSASGVVPAPAPSADDEVKAYAVLFVNDLGTNASLRTAWGKRLALVNNPATLLSGKALTYDDKTKILDNFIADQGYNTTSVAVLALIKDPMYIAHVKAMSANTASDNFVQALLTNTTLYTAYMKMLQSTVSAGNTDALDAWIVKQGYECTSAQVSASFNSMRNQNMNYWTGLYGQTTLQPVPPPLTAEKAIQKSTSTPGVLPASTQPAPSLIIYGDSTVTLGADQILNFTYKNGSLSWDIDPTGLTNNSGGKLTFSQVRFANQPGGYIGNEVSGTLTYPTDGSTVLSGQYSYFARIGQGNLPENAPGHINHPPAVTPAKQDAIGALFKYIGYIVMGGMVIEMASKLYTYAKGKFAGTPAEKTVEKTTDKAPTDESEFESEMGGTESPVNEDVMSESTSVQQLDAELQASPSVEETQELQAEKAQNAAEEEEYNSESEEPGDAAEDAEGGESTSIEDGLEDALEAGI